MHTCTVKERNTRRENPEAWAVLRLTTGTFKRHTDSSMGVHAICDIR